MPQSNKKIVMVCGSKDVDYLPRIFDVENTGCIVNAGEDTVDKMTELWAKKNKIEYVAFVPNFRVFLDDAPAERDIQMINFCDEVVILWKTPNDRLKAIGEYARSKGKSIHLCYIEE